MGVRPRVPRLGVVGLLLRPVRLKQLYKILVSNSFYHFYRIVVFTMPETIKRRNKKLEVVLIGPIRESKIFRQHSPRVVISSISLFDQLALAKQLRVFDVGG